CACAWRSLFRRARLIRNGLQSLRPLTYSLYDSLRELARAYLLFTHALFVDVVSVYAVFHRPKPSVVRALRNVCLAYVDEHHHRAKEEPRRIREVLSRATRRAAV